MTDPEGNEIGKLFVGGLPQATNSGSLRAYFTQFGDLEDAVVMMDNKTGRSRGFGYVKYKNPEAVKNALEAKPHKLDGKEIDAKQCNVNMKGRNRRSLKVFVGGISLDQDVTSLKSFFEQFGHVTDVNLMMDSNKQRHRGFAFVGFDDENTVNRLINIHYITMNNKQVEIKAMEPPNFGRKNGAALSSQNDNLDSYCKTNGNSSMQNSGLIQRGMHPSHFQGYQSAHLQCIDPATYGPHGLVASPMYPAHTTAYVSGFGASNDTGSQLQSPFNSIGGRMIGDQFSTISTNYSSINSLVPSKMHVPFIFANSFIPIAPTVYGPWNSSANMAGISGANCQPLGTACPCQIMQPQLMHPGVIGSGDEYWSQGSNVNLCTQPNNAQSTGYQTCTAGRSSSPQLNQTIPNSFFGSSQRVITNQSGTATQSSELSVAESGSVSSSMQTEAVTSSTPAPSSTVQAASPQKSVFQTPMNMPYKSNIMHSEAVAGGTYYAPLDQSQLNQGMWCPQMTGMSMQYPKNLTPTWSIPQVDYITHSLGAAGQLQKPPISVQQTTGSSTPGEENTLNESINSMAKPSGDNFDTNVNTLKDSVTIKEEPIDESKDDLAAPNSTNWQMQRPLSTWTFAGVRAPCWGDVQGGMAPHGYGLPSGILMQPHPTATAWNGMPSTYDPTMEHTFSYGYLQNPNSAGMMHPRNLTDFTIPISTGVGDPFTPGETTDIPSSNLDSKAPHSYNEQKSRDLSGLSSRNRKRESPEHAIGVHHKANRRTDSLRWIYSGNKKLHTGDKEVKSSLSDANFKSSAAGAAGDHHGTFRT